MNKKVRPEIPKEQLIQVNNVHKIDFSKPFTFIYFSWWFELLTVIPFLVAYILVLFVAIFFGFRVEGKKNLKPFRKKGCITISNHCHYFDTVFMHFTILPRHIHCSVAQRNFEVPYARRLLRILGAFPIPKGPKGFEMVSGPVGEALKRGHKVHFLPEGNLVMYSQTIHKFKSGAFRLAYIHQVPILPFVYIIKRRKLFGKEMGPAWIKFTQVIGEPIYPPKLIDKDTFPKEEIDAMSEKAATWMEETIAKHHQEKKS